ncbi:MAG TPA: helix-turn-helix domain-containing protein [Stellaceae bacterium]|nr:helix-turn-helix domain-containing protein [Stellaceae bacterium]
MSGFIAGTRYESPSRPSSPASLSNRELASLDRIGSVVTLRRDQTIFSEGDSARYFYKVVTGAVRSCRLLADGRRHICEFFLPGEFVALDADDIHHFSAEAVTDTTLKRYPRSSLEQLTSVEPRLAKGLRSLICLRLLAAQQHLVLLGRKNATERIASFLLEMADRNGDADHISLPMTRGDIADHLGLTTETVSRTFSHLRAQGVIELEGAANVLLTDSTALEELADAA